MSFRSSPKFDWFLEHSLRVRHCRAQENLSYNLTHPGWRGSLSKWRFQYIYIRVGLTVQIGKIGSTVYNNVCKFVSQNLSLGNPQNPDTRSEHAQAQVLSCSHQRSPFYSVKMKIEQTLCDSNCDRVLWKHAPIQILFPDVTRKWFIPWTYSSFSDPKEILRAKVGISTTSMETRVPARCWNVVLETTEWSAWPNSWTSVSADDMFIFSLPNVNPQEIVTIGRWFVFVFVSRRAHRKT